MQICFVEVHLVFRKPAVSAAGGYLQADGGYPLMVWGGGKEKVWTLQ